MADLRVDITVIGGGIVGLAVAHAISMKYPRMHIGVLEKEGAIARHQTGNNSGVVHSGIYYKPGSLKASLCTAGVKQVTAFCDLHSIPYQRCGKVIVATDPTELPQLDELYRRGLANGVPHVRRIGREELKEIEPNARGIAALHCPQTAIVDYTQVAATLGKLLLERGAQLKLSTKVLGVSEVGSNRFSVHTTSGDITTRYIINCAGLYSDVIARMMGEQPGVQIVPFRGEYYLLAPGRESLVRGLIYPVPDPRYPFLGVHLTRTIHGRVEAGPNAVLALAREGYTWGGVNLPELWETVTYKGFRAMVGVHWKTGLYECYRSFFKQEFVRTLQRLVPCLDQRDLEPGPTGVRAQAIALDGRIVDDFVVLRRPRAIHVVNAPSPAATSSLALGNYVAELAGETFDLNMRGA